MLKNVLYSGGGFSSLDNQRDQMLEWKIAHFSQKVAEAVFT